MPSPQQPLRDESGHELEFSDKNRYTSDGGASCAGFLLRRWKDRAALTAEFQALAHRRDAGHGRQAVECAAWPMQVRVAWPPPPSRNEPEALGAGRSGRAPHDERHQASLLCPNPRRQSPQPRGRASAHRFCRNGFSCDDPELARRVRLVRASNDMGPQTSIFDKKLTSLRPPHQWHAICLGTCAQSQVNQFVSTEAHPLKYGRSQEVSRKRSTHPTPSKHSITCRQDALQVRHQEHRPRVEIRSSARFPALSKSFRSVFATPRLGVISTQSVRSLFALQRGRPQGRRLQPFSE